MRIGNSYRLRATPRQKMKPTSSHTNADRTGLPATSTQPRTARQSPQTSAKSGPKENEPSAPQLASKHQPTWRTATMGRISSPTTSTLSRRTRGAASVEEKPGKTQTRRTRRPWRTSARSTSSMEVRGRSSSGRDCGRTTPSSSLVSITSTRTTRACSTRACSSGALAWTRRPLAQRSCNKSRCRRSTTRRRVRTRPTGSKATSTRPCPHQAKERGRPRPLRRATRPSLRARASPRSK